MRSLTDGVQRPFGPTTAYISNSLFRLKAEKEKDLDEVIRAPKQAEVNADDQIDNVIPPSPDTRRGWAYFLITLGAVGLLVLCIVYARNKDARTGFVEALFTTYSKDEGSGVKGSMLTLFVFLIIFMGIGLHVNRRILIDWQTDLNSNSFNRVFTDQMIRMRCRDTTFPEGGWGMTKGGTMKPFFLVANIMLPSIALACMLAQSLVFFKDPRKQGGKRLLSKKSQVSKYSKLMKKAQAEENFPLAGQYKNMRDAIQSYEGKTKGKIPKDMVKQYKRRYLDGINSATNEATTTTFESAETNPGNQNLSDEEQKDLAAQMIQGLYDDKKISQEEVQQLNRMPSADVLALLEN